MEIEVIEEKARCLVMELNNNKTQEKIIIEKLAKNVDLIKNFKDIFLCESSQEWLAYTDVKNKTLYINLNQKTFDFPTLVKILDGLIIHEYGHLDKRLKAPSTTKRFEQILRKIKKVNKDLLNILFDFEIHHQYLRNKRIKTSYRRKLKVLISEVRDYALEKFKKDKLKHPLNEIVLSLSYPETDFQKQVKKIVENRNYSIVKKYKEIEKLLKKRFKDYGKGKGKFSFTEHGIGEPTEEDKKEEGKGKKSKVKIRNKRSIKREIEDEHKKQEVKDRLKHIGGFSDEEVNYLIEKHNVDDLIMMCERLEETLKHILPDINMYDSKQKTRERLKSFGFRLNGYRRIRDISEVVNNVEDLVTIGKYDINGINIPLRIKRKTKGTIIILRDVSGSVSDEPLSRWIRDLTVSLIMFARKKGYRIGVCDFSSNVYPIRDRKGKFLTDDYKILMIESMLFKYGWSTLLSKALRFVNEEIKKEGLDKTNVNIIIITDSYVDNCDDVKIETKKKVNMIGLWCDEYAEKPDDEFMKLIKRYEGKIYKINQVKDKLVATFYPNIQ